MVDGEIVKTDHGYKEPRSVSPPDNLHHVPLPPYFWLTFFLLYFLHPFSLLPSNSLSLLPLLSFRSFFSPFLPSSSLSLKVRILFEECFFNSHDESYQVFCLEQPLEGALTDDAGAIVKLETLQDCCNFLWNNPGEGNGEREGDGRKEGKELRGRKTSR